MSIRKRTPEEIKKHQEIIKKHSFGFEDLKNKFREEHKKTKRAFLFQKPTKDESCFKIYKNGFIYKTMDRKKLEIWKELLKKGLVIEEIESISKKVIFEIEKEMKDNNLNIEKGQVLVKSKVNGLPLHNTRINTIPGFLKNFKTNEGARIEIAKQMIKTITSLHDNGYIHTHPHLGNWVIDVQNKKLIVRLIDMDLITPVINQYSVIKELKYIMTYLRILLKDTKYTMEEKVFRKFVYSQI